MNEKINPYDLPEESQVYSSIIIETEEWAEEYDWRQIENHEAAETPESYWERSMYLLEEDSEELRYENEAGEVFEIILDGNQEIIRGGLNSSFSFELSIEEYEEGTMTEVLETVEVLSDL